MKILSCIKDIYTSKGAIATHIKLFSYAGILVLCINNIMSVLSDYLFFSPVINVHVTRTVQCLSFLLSVILLMKFCGYEYKFANYIYGKDSVKLPEFDVKSYVVFVKMLPLILLWQFYFLFAIVICMTVIAKFNTDIYEFLPMSVLILMLPFLNIIYADFSKDFSFKKAFLNPLMIVDVMNKTFKKMFVFLVKFTVLCSVLAFVIYILLTSLNLNKAALLFVLCVLCYLAYILKLIFTAGIVDITCKNYK